MSSRCSLLLRSLLHLEHSLFINYRILGHGKSFDLFAYMIFISLHMDEVFIFKYYFGNFMRENLFFKKITKILVKLFFFKIISMRGPLATLSTRSSLSRFRSITTLKMGWPSELRDLDFHHHLNTHLDFWSSPSK